MGRLYDEIGNGFAACVALVAHTEDERYQQHFGTTVTTPVFGVEVPVVVVGDQGQSLRVVSARPVIVNAGDFGLEAGVTALREIAGLKAISTAVPVSARLVFSR